MCASHGYAQPTENTSHVSFDMIAKVAGRTVSVGVILRPSDFSFWLL